MQKTLIAHQVQMRDGSLCLYAEAGVLFADGGCPILLMNHGALRNSAVLFDWLNICKPDFDVVFVDLPGHGRSTSTATVSIENFAADVGEAITVALGSRAVVVVGESIGGLVAIALGGLNIESIRAVIAADPPITTAKLWYVRDDICRAVARDPANRFLRLFALNIFGIDPAGKIHERIYFHLFEQSRVPVLILTGDVPLFPPRIFNVFPCLFDDVDWYVVGRLAGNNAQIEVVPNCGHLLLVDAKQKCRRIISNFYDTVNDLPGIGNSLPGN